MHVKFFPPRSSISPFYTAAFLWNCSNKSGKNEEHTSEKTLPMFCWSSGERKDVKLRFSFGFRSQTSVGVALALLPNLVSRSLAGVCEIKWNQTTLNCVIKQKFLRNFDIAPRRRRAHGAEITWNTIEHVPELREHNNDSTVSCFKRKEKCYKLFCLGNFQPNIERYLRLAISLPTGFLRLGHLWKLNTQSTAWFDTCSCCLRFISKGSEKFACLTM